jgi:2-oxoisovalerate dehydrogenase E1 component
VKFAIWGPGEEVHGVATALALNKVVNPDHFGFVPHYRSGSLCSMWSTLRGKNDFTTRLLRQQFSKSTDAMSGGRQMVYHLNMPEIGILPVQSPVGMQLGKAAGYALGYRSKGVTDALTMGIVGDGTTAEGDMHDAMNAISVWSLPTIILVTDNAVAISTRPDEGRGIRDFATYARAFGVEPFSCDGRDFMDVYETTFRAATYCKNNQAPVLIHVHDLPRFNGHSSAADVTFDLTQADPLIALGEKLVADGVLAEEDVLKRIKGTGRDFFAHHQLGAVMDKENDQIRAIIDQVRGEPEADVGQLFDHIYAPFPDQAETEPGEGTTVMTYAGAIRSAIDKLISRHQGMALGQDIGTLGGVMTATAGLKARHPGHVLDSPLNEPLILGASTGLGLHEDLLALPEIQFGDYSLNAFHWLVYLGNLRWSTLGQARAKLILRMPTDPFGGGAMYHSMSLDGYFCSIPGLVIVMPSTTFDAHGLLLTAGDYEGPVVVLEPKWLYRQSLGPALPGEPSDPKEIAALRKSVRDGGIPDIPDVRVPFGKGAIRREGSDVTLVSWGRAVWTSLDAAEKLASEGLSVEVIDLRTLVPPDMDLIFESVGRTGRLLVASEDRPFAGYVRQIQGKVAETMPHVPTRGLGQKNVPGIGQSLALEHATILTAEDVMAAAREIVEVQLSSRGGWSFVPHRYFVG